MDVGSPMSGNTGQNNKVFLADKFSKLRMTTDNFKAEKGGKSSPAQSNEQS